MLTVEQALKTISNNINVLEIEKRSLTEASGQMTGEDIYAEMDVPTVDTSARDGFAVRSQDIQAASPQNPRRLRIIETVMAGSINEQRIVPGTAIRIMTGAPLPPGADCVVEFEDTDEANQRTDNRRRKSTEAVILRGIKAGDNIRKAGDQVRKGELIIPEGTSIGPAEAGVLASLGQTQVKVIRRPVVAIIATGDELVSPGKPLSNSKIYSGSSYSIALQVQRSGGIPIISGIARDNRASLIAKIRRALEADIVITTGGVSMGDHDLVKDALDEIGELVFWQVRMMPGKYSAFALDRKNGSDSKIKRIPHFALSGNPTASMIGFEILVRPSILKMMGRKDQAPNTVEAIMEDTIKNVNMDQRFVWVEVVKRQEGYYARKTGLSSQGVLSSLVSANGLAIVPEETRKAEKGDRLKVILLDWHYRDATIPIS